MTIKISKNPMYHSKTKHFESCLNFIRDVIGNKKIRIIFIPIDHQPIDILPKALSQIKLKRCRKLLNVSPISRIPISFIA